MIDGGEFDGCTVEIQRNSAVALSTKSCRDQQRWENMPSLNQYRTTLEVLAIHDSRYIRSLHESLVQLSNLKKLVIFGCSRVTALPNDIGELSQLEEVSKAFCISYLPAYWLWLES